MEQDTTKLYSLDELLQKGNEMRLAGRFDEARNCFEQAKQIAPADYKVYHRLGEFFVQQNLLDQSVEAYLQAITLAPDYAWSHHGLSIALARQKRWPEALVYSQKAVQLNKKNARIYSHLGLVLIQTQEEIEAIEAYQTAIQLEPGFVEAYEHLGELLIKTKQWQAARACYETAITLKPDSFRLAQNLAESLLQTGQIDPAIDAYQRAIQLNSKADMMVYHRLGYCFESKGNFEKAITHYAEALKLKPEFNPAYSKLLSLLPHTKKTDLAVLDEVIESCRANLAKHPDWPILHIRLGDLLSKRGKKEEALDAYRSATYQENLQHKPDFTKRYWNAGKVVGPNFIILGTMKGGTTSLYEYLNQHPQILPCSQKELHFFTMNAAEGPDWYLAQFPPIPQEPLFVTGESSPSYLDWVGECESLPAYVKELFPNVKLIALLRNPVDRTISYHYHQMRIGVEHRSLEEAIAKEWQIIQKAEESDIRKMRGTLTSSLYLYKLERWLSSFSREQLLILRSEDLFSAPEVVVRQVVQFLGLPEYPHFSYPKLNPGSYSKVSDETRQNLVNFFKPYNQRLEEQLGIMFGWS